MPFYRATVELMIKAENELEACDLVSVLLTENGVYGGDQMLRDWAYSAHPKEIDVPSALQEFETYFADGDTMRGKTK